MLPPLHLVFEAVDQLSTFVFMVYALYTMSNFVVLLTLSLDLMLIVATLVTQKYMERYLFMNRMACRVGMTPPYSRSQRQRLLHIFAAGHRQQRTARPDA